MTGLRANRAAARTPPPSSGWYALAAGSGFTALGAARQAGPGLLAAIERDLGATGFGVGLAGAWDSPVERALGSGTVSVARWELALLARAAIRRWDGGGLEALAGPALQIIEARTRGLAVDANGRYPQLGADLQLRARQRLTSRVELVAAVGLSARREGQRFHVPNAPGDLPVPAWRLQAAVGLRFGL